MAAFYVFIIETMKTEGEPPIVVHNEILGPDSIETTHNGQRVTFERDDVELWLQGMNLARAYNQRHPEKHGKQIID